ncbi:MAG: DNA polymerase III subunit gamma/tau [Patescibacteria group bacterium]|nr:DNA polymerase III subunit gamma/tau [Patescibacteria group bacterium]
MFYLKYRPQKIEEIDNNQVKEIIKKFLESKNLPHAFLFIGQKGTGKTSVARILAKAVNCFNNKFAGKNNSIEPCNQCANCLAINQSSSVDIIELDAASNRGIDDIKNLIHETNFLPMTARYRVFIIDEAHMITTEAFNALLKTLEEPPPYVIFIFATTNKDKIPKTITSRCFPINFSKAKKDDIIRMLKRISQAEKIKIEEKLFSLIFSFSDNSFRDAAKILEELVIHQKLDYEEAKNFLGFFRQNFLEILEKEDLKKALLWLDEFVASGGSVKSLIEQLLNELRLTLLAKNKVIEEEKKSAFSLKEIVLLIKILTEAYQNLKYSPIESLPLEIAVVEFYNQKSNH